VPQSLYAAQTPIDAATPLSNKPRLFFLGLGFPKTKHIVYSREVEPGTLVVGLFASSLQGTLSRFVYLSSLAAGHVDTMFSFHSFLCLLVLTFSPARAVSSISVRGTKLYDNDGNQFFVRGITHASPSLTDIHRLIN
jgi:hypothetical protein